MTLLHKERYQFQAQMGSKIEVKIDDKIKNIDKSDLEEILHEYASCTHDFYLSLGRKIADDI